MDRAGESPDNRGLQILANWFHFVACGILCVNVARLSWSANSVNDFRGNGRKASWFTGNALVGATGFSERAIYDWFHDSTSRDANDHG